jgi:chloramphenicol-sensitive protein RarD
VNQYLGLIYAVSAYTLWGIIPIFWKQIAHIDSIEIVMHRMVWACILVVGLIIIQGQAKGLLKLYKQPQLLGRLFIASLLISVNWAVFIWAVTSGYIVEASMGYFLNPLVNVLFGYLFFKERLRSGHVAALSMVALSVIYLLIAHGAVPYIALTLAVTFSCYAAVKKTISIPATHGLAIETSFLLLPALLYIVYLDQQGVGTFGTDIAWSSMLVLGGLLTLIPLILFAAAAKLVSMTTLGMSQYIGPTLQLISGVLLYNEPFGSERFITFSLIWLALLIFCADELRYQRLRRRDINTPV